jgi:uncharacterized protein (TIGR02996 family)
MTHEDAFLEDIREHPEDDAPRLIYADWLEERGDPRGEFIRVQCDLAQRSENDPRRPALEARQRELLAAHWEEWAGPVIEWVRAYRFRPEFVDQGHEGSRIWQVAERRLIFRRGFLDQVLMTAERYLEYATDLARLYPVRYLTLLNASGHIFALAARPELARLTGVNLWDNRLTSADMRVLAACRHLGGLTLLGVGFNPIGSEGVAALADSPHLARLTTLRLSHCGIHAGGVRALATSVHMARLTTLHLDSNALGNAGGEALAEGRYPRALTTLYLTDAEIGSAGAIALANSPRLAHLTHLYLHGHNPISDRGVVALANSRHMTGLQELCLEIGSPGDASVRALVESHTLAGLRRLELSGGGFSPDQEAALRARFGDRVVF